MSDEEKREEEATGATAEGTDGAAGETAAEAEGTSASEENAVSPGDGESNALAATVADGAPDHEVQHAAHDEHGGDDHGHAHGDHGHGHGGHDDHDEHLGHTAPMSLLIGVLVALSMLTILTVAVTAIDLGSQGNFVVAMIIATVKAVLVMGYFMHMFWDSKFNVVAFTSSFLFVLLFLSMALLDRSEYQMDMDKFEVDKKLKSM